MLAGAPGAACSKEFRSGSISSHPASRPCTRGAVWLKSGTRNGLASWAWTTDCGSAVRSRVALENVGSGSGSGSGSRPAWICISRSSRRVASETSASSCSRLKSEGSRVAIWARIVASPSSRLSCVSFCVGVSASSARTLARSARASRADAWNLRPLTGGQLPLVDGALDLADRHREHRDDALVVTSAGLSSTLSAGTLTGPAAAGLTSTLCGQPAALFLGESSSAMLHRCGSCPAAGVPPSDGRV